MKHGFFRTAGIYTVANALNAALPLLMLPVLTRYMSPADYGLLIMFQLLCTFMSSFTGLSVHSAVSRQFYILDRTALATYVGNCLLILFVSTAVIAVCLAVTSPVVERLSQIPAEWQWAVIAVSFFQFIVITYMSLLQMEGRAVAYGTLQIFQTTISIGLLAWMVVGLKMGWQGGVLAQVIAFAITGLLAGGLMIFQGRLSWRIVPEQIKDALWFGVPLIPHTIGITFIAMTDRVMIANLVSIAEAGIYTAGYQVGLAIALLQNSFNQAWMPWVYAKLNGGKEEDKRSIVRYTYYYFGLILILVAALGSVAPFILEYLVGAKFAGASDYVFWIGLGYAFNGMYKMVCVHIFFQSKTHILAWITAFTALLNILLTFYAIKINGAVGAAQATAFAFFVSFVLTWLLSMRVQSLPWNLRKRI